MLTLKLKKKFHAAHSLPGLGGKCARLHGHTWKVILAFEVGTPDPETGITVDFGYLDEIVGEVLSRLDHAHLNEVMPPGRPPSAENIAMLIGKIVARVLRKEEAKATLLSVEIWETDTNCAVYTLKEGIGI